MKGILVETLKFGLVGLLNTAVGLGAIFFAVGVLGARPIWANVIGYVLGLAVSFVLDARWTFRSRATKRILFRFLGAFAASYALNLIVLIWAMRGGVGPYLGQTLAVASYAIAFFMLCKLVVFASSRGIHESCRALRRMNGLRLRHSASRTNRAARKDVTKVRTR